MTTKHAWEVYNIYLKWSLKARLDFYMLVGPAISVTQFQTNRYCDFDTFDPYPEVGDVQNAFNTLSSNDNIVKVYTQTAALAHNFNVYSWIEFFVQLTIQSNGRCFITQ